MASFNSLLLLVTLAVSHASASILTNVADLNKLGLKFDFIVLGGGTAGNVIANRLSENPNYQVLVLEAGGSNIDVQNIIVPGYCVRAAPFSPQDWNYTTTPQTALSGRVLPYPRGFVLGGSSSINFLAYTRGSKDDFDRFAKITGDQGWSWNSLIPYMKKNERFSTSTQDHHNISGQYDPSVHGFNGINTVSLAGFTTTEVDKRILKATTESKEFTFNVDNNSGNQLGFSYGQATIKDGSRSSSATSYLAPNFVARPNLHVLLNARATRVLETATGVFRGVEFVQDLNGPKYNLTAKKEIVLSTGTVATPNLLMHSGIGDSATLKSLGITPLVNLPSVGQNVSDHTLLYMGFNVNTTDTWDTANQNQTVAAEQLAEWTATKTGPLVDLPVSLLGWFRTDLGGRPDGSAGPHTGQYELIVSNGFIGIPPPSGNYLSVVPVVVSPTARGSISINSKDSLAAPLINPNLLGSDADFFVMRQGLKSALRFASLPAWKGYVLSPLGLEFNSTDTELDAYIRENSNSVSHLAGSASMSPKGAKWGVVDPDLKVKGVSGLRIVDLSIVPHIPAAHTQAATYIIAERAADLIKAAWGPGYHS